MDEVDADITEIKHRFFSGDPVSWLEKLIGAFDDQGARLGAREAMKELAQLRADLAEAKKWRLDNEWVINGQNLINSKLEKRAVLAEQAAAAWKARAVVLAASNDDYLSRRGNSTQVKILRAECAAILRDAEPEAPFIQPQKTLEQRVYDLEQQFAQMQGGK